MKRNRYHILFYFCFFFIIIVRIGVVLHTMEIYLPLLCLRGTTDWSEMASTVARMTDKMWWRKIKPFKSNFYANRVLLRSIQSYNQRTELLYKDSNKGFIIVTVCDLCLCIFHTRWIETLKILLRLVNTNTPPVVKFVNDYIPSFHRDMWMFCCNPSGDDWQPKYCISPYFH